MLPKRGQRRSRLLTSQKRGTSGGWAACRLEREWRGALFSKRIATRWHLLIHETVRMKSPSCQFHGPADQAALATIRGAIGYHRQESSVAPTTFFANTPRWFGGNKRLSLLIPFRALSGGSLRVARYTPGVPGFTRV
jgi:hypothetical protein